MRGATVVVVVVVVNCDVACILHATTHREQPQDKPKPFPSPDSGKTNAPRGRAEFIKIGRRQQGVGLQRMQRLLTGWLSCDAIASAHSHSFQTQHQIQKGEASVRQQDDHDRDER